MRNLAKIKELSYLIGVLAAYEVGSVQQMLLEKLPVKRKEDVNFVQASLYMCSLMAMPTCAFVLAGVAATQYPRTAVTLFTTDLLRQGFNAIEISHKKSPSCKGSP